MRGAALRTTLATMAALAAATALAAPAPAAPPRYTATELGTLGGSYSVAVAVNDRGQVAGNSAVPGDLHEHAFLWEDGVMTDLGSPGGGTSRALSLSEAGHVAGVYDNVPDEGAPLSRAFVWFEGVFTDLGPTFCCMEPPSPGSGAGIHVNARGDVLFPLDLETTVEWTLHGGDGVDQTLPEGVHPRGLNERGQVVGFRTAADDRFRAFSWQDGRLTDLPGLVPGGASEAVAVNERGQVAGRADVTTGDDAPRRIHPVLWTRGRPAKLSDEPVSNEPVLNDRGSVAWPEEPAGGGTRMLLGRNGRSVTVAAFSASWAFARPLDITNRDEVLVQALPVGGPTRYFIWQRGVLVPLPAGSRALDVNDRGVVAGGWGRPGTGPTGMRAVIWR